MSTKKRTTGLTMITALLVATLVAGCVQPNDPDLKSYFQGTAPSAEAYRTQYATVFGSGDTPDNTTMLYELYDMQEMSANLSHAHMGAAKELKATHGPVSQWPDDYADDFKAGAMLVAIAVTLPHSALLCFERDSENWDVGCEQYPGYVDDFQDAWPEYIKAKDNWS